jgi:hypothetical protein
LYASAYLTKGELCPHLKVLAVVPNSDAPDVKRSTGRAHVRGKVDIDETITLYRLLWQVVRLP